MEFGKNKKHLSYSAIDLWMKNKDRYRAKYYDGEVDNGSIYSHFGNRVHKLLEDSDYNEYPILAQVPKYSVHEQPIEVEIRGIPVRGFIDLYEPSSGAYADLKTGIVHHTNGPPWNKVKVRKHEQLPFYSLLIQRKFGKVRPTCHLIWLQTQFIKVNDAVGSRVLESDSRDLELTGKMEIFPRIIKQWERDRIEDIISKVGKEINEDYRRTQKSI